MGSTPQARNQGTTTMKLTDLKRLNELNSQRDNGIICHKYLSEALRPHIQIGRTEVTECWSAIRPVVLAHFRSEIEKAEADLRALGIEVESHFKTDADGWLKPTSPLADMLTARGYNLVGTGGNCKAWVKVTGDEEHIVISDLHGGSEPDINDWMVSRFRTEEWDDGHTQRSSDSERDFWSAVDHAEATPAYEG